MGDLTKYDIELQLEEITSLTTSKDELSATLETLKTENTTLAGQIKESVETIKKFADEKKTIGGQLEEANNSTKLLQGKLGDMQTKVESTEKLMAKVNEELQAKVKANTTISVQLEEATKNSNKEYFFYSIKDQAYLIIKLVWKQMKKSCNNSDQILFLFQN